MRSFLPTASKYIRNTHKFSTASDNTHDTVIREAGAKAWNIDFKDGPVFTNKLSFIQPKEFASTPLSRMLDLDGKIVSSDAPDIPKELCRKMLETMIKAHMMDVVMYDAQRQGRVSFHMTQFGEEGAIVGTAAALENTDMIYAQYREAALLMYRGFSINSMLAQCMGTVEDGGKGRQMPIHYGSPELCFQTISSPLSTQIPQASGAGYVYRIQNQNKISVCFFGDGAASEGDFHAGMNFAATLGCQTLFVCRNNGYAISTPASEQYHGDGILQRGVAYGMRSIRVDGNDVIACYAAVKKARELIIEHKHPVLIEAMTYRGGHHSTSDDSTRYRAKSEIDFWMKSLNPVVRFTKYCQDKGFWTEEDTQRTRQEARQEVIQALEEQDKKPKWGVETMFDDVYSSLTPNLIQQKNELMAHLEEFGDSYPNLHGGSSH